MSFLSGFNVTLEKAKLLGEAAMGSFAGAPVPSGWDVVTPAELGLGSNYQDGNYYRNGSTGASAIVLRQGNEYIVSFRGTDDATDTAYYSELFFGTYINHFSPLLSALASQAPAGAHFSFTGASLGGGATNNLAAIADSAYGSRFTDATFVAFASPNITNASGILNLGVENDPVYKAVNTVFPFTQYQDYASSIDNLVLANDSYVAGSLSDMDAHSAKSGFDVFDRLSNSRFYDLMTPDSPIVIADSDGIIQDHNPGRTTTGAFYLGRSVADQIVGRGGNDYIEGFTGNDNLDGGAGNDVLDGGIGNDTLTGSDGGDVFVFRNSYGSDTITDFDVAGPLHDEIDVSGLSIVSNFADIMGYASQLGVNTVFNFGSGLVLTLSDVALASLTADDFLFGVQGVTITGTSSSETIDATHRPSGQLFPTSENDTIYGMGGSDVVHGLAGNDVIDGGTGNDTLYGDDGNDTLIGGAGTDKLYGGNGHDSFFISGSNDTSDIFNGEAGTDKIVVTGSGSVTLAGFNASSSSIETWQGNGQAVLGNSSANVLNFSGLTDLSGLLYVDGGSGNDTITGSSSADDLRGNSGNDTLYGNDDNDTLTGGAGIDKLYAGNGEDKLVISGSNDISDIFDGGTGTDTIVVTGTGSVTLAGFNATASLVEVWQGNGQAVLGNSSANVFDFSGLTDVSGLLYVDGGSGNDIITGSSSADDLRGNSGNDTLNGGDGNDTLSGGGGSDTINGGANDDTITGGAGKDTMIGGDGSDTFVFTATSDSTSSARDTIVDFEEGVDKIDLSAIDANTASGAFGNQNFMFVGSNAIAVANSVTFAQNGGNTVVSAEINGNSTADLVIVLSGLHTLTANDFIL
jgi:Ca2+-binding RTX toxin-like protein